MVTNGRRHKLFILIALWGVLNICTILSGNVRAQEDATAAYADSLLNIAMEAPSTELKIERLLDVSYFWSTRDTTKAYRYLAEARKLMDNPPTDYQQGLYQLYQASILMEYAPEQAKEGFLVADSLLAKGDSPKHYFYRSKLWNNYNVIIQIEDRNEEFMNIVLEKALPYARRSGDSSSVAYQLNNIAIQMENVVNYEGASKYYEAALRTIRNTTGTADRKMELFSNAARNEIFQRNYDKAKIYLDSARRLLPSLMHSTYLPAFYRTEFLYYRHQKNQEKALESYHKGIEAAKRLNDAYILTDLNFELYAFYRDLGDYKKAKHYLRVSRQTQPYDMLRNNGLYHYEMAKTEYQLSNYQSAYLHLDTLNVLLDSLYVADVATKIQSLEVKHATAEKENEILRLEADNRQQELKIAKTRSWTFVLGGGFLLALSVIFFTLKIGQKNKRLLQQKEQLHEEELRTIRQQEKLRQFDAMLQGQEAERNRLAKDLHDGLGGLLAGVKLKLSSIVAKTDTPTATNPDAVEDVIQQLDYSVDELRRIAHNMMPESLRYGGLAPALCDLCRYMSTPEVRVTFQDLGVNDQYPEPLRIAVYRVIQELLTNAIKHAEAKEIIVQCSELDDWLFVTVEDNGKGMDMEKSEQANGLGLINIHNRISLLNGQVETLSAPGEGTTVNIQIPRNYE